MRAWYSSLKSGPYDTRGFSLVPGKIVYTNTSVLHVTQPNPRAHPELAQLAAVQSVVCRATWTHLKHAAADTRAGKQVTFRVARCCCVVVITLLALHSKTSVGARGHSTRRTHRRKETALGKKYRVVRTHHAILLKNKKPPFGG